MPGHIEIGIAPDNNQLLVTIDIVFKAIKFTFGQAYLVRLTGTDARQGKNRAALAVKFVYLLQGEVFVKQQADRVTALDRAFDEFAANLRDDLFRCYFFRPGAGFDVGGGVAENKWQNQGDNDDDGKADRQPRPFFVSFLDAISIWRMIVKLHCS